MARSKSFRLLMASALFALAAAGVGAATTVPGKIEAEAYASMAGVQLESCSEGTQNVGWIDTGDWMAYAITVPTTGSYTIEYRVASPNSNAVVSADYNAGANQLGSVAVPNTGDWQKWATVSQTVNLPAGTYNLGVFAQTGGFNLNWINIIANATDTGPAGYTRCAGENGSYTFSQTVDVAYGANGAFAYKTGVSGTIHFDNATFGDPIPGVAKAGYYKVSGPAGPAGYTWCASENGAYTFSQTVDVAYGANGTFAYKSGVSGTINFNNATFGDPLPGVAKAGFYKVAGDYTIYPGFIGVDLHNDTQGAWRDDQIYITIIAEDPNTHAKIHVFPDGHTVPCSVADNDAPGHLVKKDTVYPYAERNYANYSFTLADTKLIKIPQVPAGRIFVSMGSPFFTKINTDINGLIGYEGPDMQNPTNPNIDIYFDWYEFTWASNGLWVNTSQVDMFGFPLLLDVYGSNRTFHKQTGITESRASLLAAFQAETPAEFHDLLQDPYRLVAPCKGSFNEGRVHGHYLDSYIDQMWSLYTSRPLVIDMWGGSRRFSGLVQSDNRMVFTEVNLGNGAYQGGTYTIPGKPNTQEAMEARGVLATGNGVETALEAQIGAALSRHIMEDPSKWATPSTWYSASPTNYWGKFWHAHSIDNLSYAFSYDDVSDQSSTIVATAPEHMVFGIRW